MCIGDLPRIPVIMVRAALIVGYIGVAVAAMWHPLVPRLFWTVLLPLLPIGIVLGGFYRWRRACPLAAFGELGTRMPRQKQRRVPKWAERHFFAMTFGLLLVMLVLRHTTTNGDGMALGVLLLALGAAAALTNAVFTGKTWCNFVCPVGFVERMYTEPASLKKVEPTSRCVRCTACKRNCPDIDQENAYWKDVHSGARRIASYAFPGLILGFYGYFWLQTGSWDFYFDGEWTRGPAPTAGFYFWPDLPPMVAATATLGGASALSVGGLVGLETLIARVWPEEARHKTLALAAGLAFLSFYAFAGAPGLGKLPGGARFLALVAPIVATIFVARRWGRTRLEYLGEKSVAKLLRDWHYDAPPPATTDGVLAYVKGHKEAQGDQQSAYEDTVREVVADGIVSLDERVLLDRLRERLGIDESVHNRVLASLNQDQRERLEVPMERRLQLQGYEAALQEALLAGAPSSEIDVMRLDWAVSREDHERLAEKLATPGGPLHEAARRHLKRIGDHRDELSMLAAMPWFAPYSFLAHVLVKKQDRQVDRVVEALALSAADAPSVRRVAPSLFAQARETRREALEHVLDGVPEDIAAALTDVVMKRMPAPNPAAGNPKEVVDRLMTSDDPWLRAGALMAAGQLDHKNLEQVVAAARSDPHPAVQEEVAALANPERKRVADQRVELPALKTGRYTAAPIPGETFGSLTVLERMLYLRCVSLFIDLDPDELYQLAGAAVELTLPAGAPIWRRGDVGGSLYVVVGGAATVGTLTAAPGETLGELAILDGSPHRDDLTAGPDGVRLVAIPPDRCRSLLTNARIAPQLVAALPRNLREARDGR